MTQLLDEIERDVLGERQCSISKRLLQPLQPCQEIIEHPNRDTVRKPHCCSEFEQMVARDPPPSTSQRKSEALVSIWKGRRQVVRGCDPPFTIGRRQDRQILRVDIAIAGEPSEAELLVEGAERDEAPRDIVRRGRAPLLLQ